MLEKSSVFFWVAKFCTKNWVQRIFLGGKAAKLPYFAGKKKA
jgi:hypothetical protein